MPAYANTPHPSNHKKKIKETAKTIAEETFGTGPLLSNTPK